MCKYRSNSGKSRGEATYHVTAYVKGTDIQKMTKLVDNVVFDKVSSGRQYRHGYNQYERHANAISLLTICQGYVSSNVSGNTNVCIESAHYILLDTPNLEAELMCEDEYNIILANQKKLEEQEKVFSAMPYHEEIRAVMKDLDDDDDYFFGYGLTAFLICFAQRMCWFTGEWRELAAGEEIFISDQNKCKYAFVKDDKLMGLITIPKSVNDWTHNVKWTDFAGTIVVKS